MKMARDMPYFVKSEIVEWKGKNPSILDNERTYVQELWGKEEQSKSWSL